MVRIPYPGAVCRDLNRGNRRQLAAAHGGKSATFPSWTPASQTKKYDNLMSDSWSPLYRSAQGIQRIVQIAYVD